MRGRRSFLFSAGEIRLGAGGLKSLEKVESRGPVAVVTPGGGGSPC